MHYVTVRFLSTVSIMMFQHVLQIGSVMRVGQTVLTDFGPSLSVLFSIFAVGAWFLGLQFEIETAGTLAH